MQKKKRAQRADTNGNQDDNWKDSKLFESFLQQDQIQVYQSIVDKDKLNQFNLSNAHEEYT